MAEQDVVVIVDDQGNEHEFPPGFDPKRAAAIVRQRTTPLVTPAAEATPLGHQLSGRTGFQDPAPTPEPDTYWGGVRKGLSDYAGELGASMFQSAAQPHTTADFLGLIVPGQRLPATTAIGTPSMPSMPTVSPGVARGTLRGVGMAGRAYGGITGRVIGRVADAAADLFGRTPAATPEAGGAAAATNAGRTVTAMQPVEPPPPPAAPYTPATLDARSPTLTMRGTLARPAGAPPGASGSVSGGAPPPAPPAAGLSAAERAALVKQGFDEPTIARIEAEAARQGSSAAPPSQNAALLPQTAAPPPQNAALLPQTAAPPPQTAAPPPQTAAAVEPAAAAPSAIEAQLKASLAERRGATPPAEPPGVPPIEGEPGIQAFRAQPEAIDALRQEIGAEKAGRLLDMTTEEVRQAATEIGAGANRGDASLVLPEPRLKAVVEKILEMKPGSLDRLEYVDRTTNPKNWAQFETARRVIEILKLVVPVGTTVGVGDALRDRVRQRLQEQ